MLLTGATPARRLGVFCVFEFLRVLDVNRGDV
jgi:hypothetical protein